jgi:hypothetical protein
MTEIQTVSTSISDEEMRALSDAYLTGRDMVGTTQAEEMAAAYADQVQRAFRDLQKKVRVEFTERDPYEGLGELQHDVLVNKQMLVYTGFSDVPLWTPEINWMARAVHDYDHVIANTDFSLPGELHAFQIAADRAPQLEPLYLSEIALQAATSTVEGAFPEEQRVVFASPEVARAVTRFRRNDEGAHTMVWDAAGALKFMSPEEMMEMLGAQGMSFEEALELVIAAETASDLSGTAEMEANARRKKKRRREPPATATIDPEVGAIYQREAERVAAERERREEYERRHGPGEYEVYFILRWMPTFWREMREEQGPGELGPWDQAPRGVRKRDVIGLLERRFDDAQVDASQWGSDRNDDDGILKVTVRYPAPSSDDAYEKLRRSLQDASLYTLLEQTEDDPMIARVRTPNASELSASEVTALPIGSIVRAASDYLAIVPDGAVPITILPERAASPPPEGEPIEQWGDTFLLVRSGTGRVPTHGTAQRHAMAFRPNADWEATARVAYRGRATGGQAVEHTLETRAGEKPTIDTKLTPNRLWSRSTPAGTTPLTEQQVEDAYVAGYEAASYLSEGGTRPTDPEAAFLYALEHDARVPNITESDAQFYEWEHWMSEGARDMLFSGVDAL